MLTHAALAWVLRQDGVTSAILGASKPDQLQESLDGMDVRLDDEEMRACDDVWYELPRERDPNLARR
jgi:aryl-alcohol dehydrogenase-like predicted oxidoreductase